ncbi:MAG: hypothetical protein EOO05_01120 [Chitinophagaceae bacterium]|nr:MAG: hypothetical protein EOO05_01120 [Chitinophagaceae bacterium]
MIPKIFHYCWYGGDPLPEEYIENIEGWKTLNPDWTVKRWDETNSPLDVPYLQTAFAAKMWANMSNYIRFHVLAEEGGVYLDTDIRMIRSFDALVAEQCFLGFEEGEVPGSVYWVNDAVVGCVAGHEFIRQCLRKITTDYDGTEDANLSAPQLVTTILRENFGLTHYGAQMLGDIRLYPTEVFYPVHYKEMYKMADLDANIAESTLAVHTWGRSWLSRHQLLMMVDELNFSTEFLRKRAERSEAVLGTIRDISRADPDVPGAVEGTFLIGEQFERLQQSILLIRREQEQLSQRYQSLNNSALELLKLKQENEQLQAEIQIRSEIISALNEKHHSTELLLSSSLEELRIKNAALQGELDVHKSKQGELDRLQEERQRLTGELVKGLQARIAMMQQKEGEFERSLASMTEFHKEADERLKSAHETHAKLIRENEELGMDMVAKSQLIRKLTDENTSMIRLTAEAEQVFVERLAESAAKLAELEARYQSVTQQLSAFSAVQEKNNEELIGLLQAKVNSQRNTVKWYQDTYENRKLLGIVKDRIVKKFK